MQLASGMAKLMKDRVLLEKLVVRVEQDKSGASVYCANGEIYKVRRGTLTNYKPLS